MLESISRSYVHDDIRSRIRAFIRDNALQPGDRLPGEAVLATSLEVGRPAVREALRAMEAVGAIESRKGVGWFVGAFAPATFVSQFTTESLVASFSERELLEVRCLLEIASFPEAVARLTDDDFGELRELLDGMRTRISHQEPYVDEDLGMHRVLMRHVDNRLLTTMLDAVYALTKGRVDAERWFDAQGAPSIHEETFAEHAELVDAILAHDTQRALHALVHHFDTTAARMGFRPSWHSLDMRPDTSSS